WLVSWVVGWARRHPHKTTRDASDHIGCPVGPMRPSRKLRDTTESPIRVVELLPERALFLEEPAALCLMPVHERIMAAALVGHGGALPFLVHPWPGFIMLRDPLCQLLLRLP